MNFFIIFYILTYFINYIYSVQPDKENLKKLTEYRQQHRKTVDGRLCAAAFVQEDRVYTDCTKATDPNGITGKEWCYVEVQLIGKGNKFWEYCKGVINYDVVRSKARLFFQVKANELFTAVHKLQNESKKLVSIHEKFQEVCGATSDLIIKKIDEINSIAKNSSRNINKLLLLAATINETHNQFFEISDQVEKNRKAFLKNKKNCSIIKGYNIEQRPDGLIGSFYDNAYFSGYPISINNDKFINFIWDTGIPIEKIPYQHFSVRWDGFLKIPESDNYVISVEHDCGVRIFLDNSPIIVDNMPEPKEDESEENKPVNILSIEKLLPNVRKSESKLLGLVGGKKYKLRIEYFHLSTVKFENPDTAHIILFWKSNNIPEEIIPPNFFFQGNVSQPLRLTELKDSDLDIFLLENGSFAFSDSFNFIINDIPGIHENSKAIRSFHKTKKKNIQFKINVNGTVHVALPKGSNAPNNDINKTHFEKSKETISVFEIHEEDPKSNKQEIFNIFSSEFDEGEVSITLDNPTPFIVFVNKHKLTSDIDCKGYVQVISLTNSVFYDSCYVSSQESEKFDCKAGFSGNNQDKEFHTWRTAKGKALGQYITVNFKHDIQIHSFTFKTLKSEENHVTELSIYFPNIKNPEIFSILPGHNHYKFKKPIKTNTIKAVITKVHDKSNQTGGNIAFYGLPCIDQKKQQKILEDKHKNEINIIFRNKDVNIIKPSNWQVDNGKLKQQQGIFNFGWNKKPTPIPVESLTDVNKAGISFSPLDCLTDEFCDTNNKWSIDLINNGVYSLSIEIGSPTGRQEINSLSVNNTVFINDIFLKPGQFTKVTSEINIKNKSLELSTNTNTVIQSVQLLFLHE